MANDDQRNSLDRRIFLSASTAAVVGLPSIGLAQHSSAAAAVAPNEGGKKVSETIADFIVGFDLKNAPPTAIERARIAFVDTIGVMLAGSQLPPADIVCDVVKLQGSTPAATLVGRDLRASPPLAALANGIAGHCMDFDLTYFAGQSIAAVIPALLPVAETAGATSAELLAAFIIAAEVAGRINRAAPTASRVSGWHATGTIGVIAAAAGCARLMKIDPKKIPDVIGMTTSMASGVSINFGTMTKPLHSGHAAHDGVLAAMLGARGFTSNATALEGKDGYFACFARGLPWSLDPFADLGQSYDLVQHGYKLKPYPSGGLGHTAIDAALELRAAVNLARHCPCRRCDHQIRGAPLYRQVSALGRKRQVQRTLSCRLHVRSRRADALSLHRDGAGRRSGPSICAKGLALDLSGLRRSARRIARQGDGDVK